MNSETWHQSFWIARCPLAALLDAMSEVEFVNFLRGVHQKLGAVQNSTLRRTNFAWHNSGHATIRLDYDTIFVRGSGTEVFLWEVADHRVLLYRYKINSKDLAINESTRIPPTRE